MELITSPFIEVRGNFVRNLLTGNRVPLEPNELRTLLGCRNPIPFNNAVELYTNDAVLSLYERELLLDSSSVWGLSNVRSVEIETSKFCNWKCQCCPMSLENRQQSYMKMTLFREIIEKVCRHNSIKTVTFNSYNEPTLDKFFDERVLLVSKTRLKLKLHTNATGLSSERVQMLRDLNVLERVVFNVPAIDPAEFKAKTGSSEIKATLQKVEYACELELPVEISVLTRPNESQEHFSAVKERFQSFPNVSVSLHGISDRAGSVRNSYFLGVKIKNQLHGCPMVLDWLHIGIDGSCFICCEDFSQREVFANIQDGEIKQILSSSRAQSLRKKVFGYEEAPSDFICRSCIEMRFNVGRFGIVSDRTRFFVKKTHPQPNTAT